MRKDYTISDQSGFTLCEGMVVVAIVSVLATISIASYVVFGNKAKTVEAEIALAEVSRREMLYHDAQGKYSSDLQSIGYTPTPPLKYYTIEVQVRSGLQGIEFRATAKSTSNPQADSWVLTHYENGNTVLEKGPPAAMAGGGSGGGLSDSPDSAGGSLGNAGSGASGGGPSSKGPGTVIQTMNSSTGGSMSSGSQPGTNASPSGR
ncbi:MAG: prepilin-type N-terminal cleavage/methylation domain-containing protein [Nitrospirota bacterium]|nr:prepilin-type N-terminal cleavage/methylation domain-containing protein [Nitrospirota bacterium]